MRNLQLESSQQFSNKKIYFSQQFEKNSELLSQKITQLNQGSSRKNSGKIVKNQSLSCIPLGNGLEGDGERVKDGRLSGSRIVKNRGLVSMKFIRDSTEMKNRGKEKQNESKEQTIKISQNLKKKKLEERNKSLAISQLNSFTEGIPKISSSNKLSTALKKISSTKLSRNSILESTSQKNFIQESTQVGLQNPSFSKDLNRYSQMLDKFTQERKKIVQSITHALSKNRNEKQNIFSNSQGCQNKFVKIQERQNTIIQDSDKKISQSTKQTGTNTQESLETNKNIEPKEDQVYLRTSIKTLSLQAIEEKDRKQIERERKFQKEIAEKEKIIAKYLLERNLWKNKYYQLKSQKESIGNQAEQKYKNREQYQNSVSDSDKNESYSQEQFSSKNGQYLSQERKKFLRRQSSDDTIISKISFISSCEEINPPSSISLIN